MSSDRSEPTLVRWFPHLCIAQGILLVLQGFLGGRGLFKNHDLIEVHGYVGEFIFLLAAVIVIAAWQGRQTGRLGKPELVISLINIALVIAQLGLGFSTRDSVDAAAWHLANAVLVSGTTFALIALSLRRPMPAEPMINQ